MDRVAALLPGSHDRSPELNMKRLMSVLSPSVIVPEPDKYYVFVYKAKTPGTTYDQHPFIVCTNIYKWGFTGYNIHWEGVRQYSWAEVLTNLYEVSDEELNSVQRLPIAKIRRS